VQRSYRRVINLLVELDASLITQLRLQAAVGKLLALLFLVKLKRLNYAGEHDQLVA
jgi:hypothetical protein